jgi:DNA adenine methylase
MSETSMPFSPLANYPGGKRKLMRYLRPVLFGRGAARYVEPFFGGGNSGLYVAHADQAASYVFNDVDVGIYSMWSTVQHHREAMKKRISLYIPRREHHERMRFLFTDIERPTDPKTIIRLGFAKFAAHRISFSGLGLVGNVLGGPDAKCEVDHRWRPAHHIRCIDYWHSVIASRKIVFANDDWRTVLAGCGENDFVYLDPPYPVERQFYLHGFTEADHVELAATLKAAKFRWALSYNNHWSIWRLYDGWADIQRVFSESAMSRVHTETCELIITPMIPGHLLTN